MIQIENFSQNCHICVFLNRVLIIIELKENLTQSLIDELSVKVQ